MNSPTDAELYLRGREPPARGGRTPTRPVPGNHTHVTSSWFRSRAMCKE